MNLTLAVDRKVVERARKVAESMGLSLNQAVRNFLEELAGGNSADADVSEVTELSSGSGGRSRGWAFDRDDLHERS
jgi:hypothetical protein